MSTAADRLLDQFLEGGWRFVISLPDRQLFETLHVDFKLTEQCDGTLGKGDRRHLSQALSGFANADGGLLVWGLDARLDDEGFDRVIGLHPISNLGRFVSELNCIEPQSVSPIVAGTRHVPIASDGSDTGVAVTVVPASDAPPHMATGSGLHRYYRRSGASFMPMQHHEIADLFGRRPHPSLSLEGRWRVRPHTGTPEGGYISALLELHLTIRNAGRGTAHLVSVALAEPQGWPEYRVPGTAKLKSELMPVRTSSNWWSRVAAPLGSLVYPEDEMDVGCVWFLIDRQRRDYPQLSVRFGLTAQDYPMQTGTLCSDGEAIERAAQNVFEGKGATEWPASLEDAR